MGATATRTGHWQFASSVRCHKAGWWRALYACHGAEGVATSPSPLNSDPPLALRPSMRAPRRLRPPLPANLLREQWMRFEEGEREKWKTEPARFQFQELKPPLKNSREGYETERFSRKQNSFLQHFALLRFSQIVLL
jgi:hypothetical protein